MDLQHYQQIFCSISQNIFRFNYFNLTKFETRSQFQEMLSLLDFI